VPNCKPDCFAWDIVQLPVTGTNASLASNQYAWSETITQNIRNGTSIVSITFAPGSNTGTLSVVVNTANVKFCPYLIEGTLTYNIIVGGVVSLYTVTATPTYPQGLGGSWYTLTFAGVMNSLFTGGGYGTLTIRYTNRV
jgi:hypothetical protein